MPFQHPEEIGYGYVIERYAARKDSGYARYLVLKSGRFLRPEWPHAEQFVRHLIDDSATITDGELEALLGYEWRSRLTAAWLIGVGRRAWRAEVRRSAGRCARPARAESGTGSRVRGPAERLR
ncbi:DUF6000 family protein [Streptomyces albogriseolus]|uniref:DUF6000 family protein n=1 Tax=Streptomyces albogriseolus TaxID=1887 RepID=UPI0037F45A83